MQFAIAVHQRILLAWRGAPPLGACSHLHSQLVEIEAKIVAMPVGTKPARRNSMARPRRIIPGATYLLTRRAYQRTLRLRPHPVTNQIIRYCLAWAAERHGVLIHAAVAMSNHIHLVATDPRGVLPDFLRELHRNIAKALNASQGQRDNLWSQERASTVLLPTADDIVSKIAYTAANPIAAGLVEDPDHWPGVVHWKPGTTVAVKRPDAYFDPDGCAPASVELRIVPVPNLFDGAACAVTRLRDAVVDAVRRAQADVRSRGMKFLGRAKVLGTGFLQRARAYEARFQINPIIAARDVGIRKACLAVERAFQSSYRAAMEAWQSGNRSIAFPFGTWWMRVHHTAAVLPA